LFLTGRTKDMINRGGKKNSPHQAAIWTTLANAWIHEQASPPGRFS